MLTFTLAISCLTTSNLPWFMDLTFQVLTQYYSLQHQSLLPSPVTSTTWHCFCFGLVSSFFLELFLWSPVAYRAPTDLGNSSFSFLSFWLYMLLMGFSRQEYWSNLHVLSEVSTMTHPSWVALHGIAHCFTELDKTVVHLISLISFLWLWFSVYSLIDKDKRLMEASWWERLTEGKTGSCSNESPTPESWSMPIVNLILHLLSSIRKRLEAQVGWFSQCRISAELQLLIESPWIQVRACFLLCLIPHHCPNKSSKNY